MTTDQIAKQACQDIDERTDDLDMRKFAIIKAAIEKALAAQPDGMLSGGIQRMDKALLRGKAQAVTPAPDSREASASRQRAFTSRAAQASEQLVICKCGRKNRSDNTNCYHCGERLCHTATTQD